MMLVVVAVLRLLGGLLKWELQSHLCKSYTVIIRVSNLKGFIRVLLMKIYCVKLLYDNAIVMYA